MIKKYQAAIVEWAALILVIALFGIWSKWNLFSEYNMKSIIETATPLVITCLGMSFLFAHGGMDISSGAVVALAGLGAVALMNRTGFFLAGYFSSNDYFCCLLSGKCCCNYKIWLDANNNIAFYYVFCKRGSHLFMSANAK